LAFSTRKADCSRSERSVQTVGECLEHRRKLDCLDGPEHVCGRRQRIAIQQVLPDRPLKEHWVLRDKSNRFAQRGQRVARERLLFEEDATGFRFGGAHKKAS
jgi:hypothetical protein